MWPSPEGRTGESRTWRHGRRTASPHESRRPGTTYRYRAWFSLRGHGSSPGPVTKGSFGTAPRDREAAPLRLAFGGDLNGQNVCRDAAEGMPIMETVRARHPDVFVGLGDIIYADNACSAV